LGGGDWFFPGQGSHGGDQVSSQLQAVESAVGNQGVGHGSEFSAALRAEDEMVFRSDFGGAYGVLDEVVVKRARLFPAVG